MEKSAIPVNQLINIRFCIVIYVILYFHLRKCLRPLLSAPSERSHDLSLLFDQDQFLKHRPSAEWLFFSHFFDTQIFTAFIEQRSFSHTDDNSLAYFDECAEKVGQLQGVWSYDTCTVVWANIHSIRVDTLLGIIMVTSHWILHKHTSAWCSVGTQSPTWTMH